MFFVELMTAKQYFMNINLRIVSLPIHNEGRSNVQGEIGGETKVCLTRLDLNKRLKKNQPPAVRF